MGEQNAHRLWKRHGIEFSLLAVCFFCLLYDVIFLDSPFCRYSLERLKVFEESDHVALVTRVFWR